MSFFSKRTPLFFARPFTTCTNETQMHTIEGNVNTMADVICMGELLAEFVSTADNVSLAHSPGFIKAPGGAPANVAVALQRLGTSACFVGKVGDDPFGEFLRESLAQTGVDVTYLFSDPHARTTAVFVAVWGDGHKDLCFYRNPGADMLISEADITPRIFDGARCFHYGSISFIDQPSSAAQHKALKLARERGLMISYDPNYRPTLWPDAHTAQVVIQDGFRYCHLAKISAEEWEIATGTTDLERGIAFVMSHGVELLVLSRGEAGALVTNGDYRIEMPAYPIDVVETTGAGDGFVAAMITRLLPEFEKLGSLTKVDALTMREALRYANAVGALTCTRRGAIPALPTRDEVNNFIQHNK
jgi:fructokinase